MIEREYPLVNTWGAGSYVARVPGKRDREWGFVREFVRGVPDKANGLLRYSLADLGGPGWAIARDRRRVTILLELGELSYRDHGEVDNGDVLRVIKARGSWDGAKCDGADDLEGVKHRRPRAIVDGICTGCVELEQLRVEEVEQAERVKVEQAAAPNVEPF